MTQGINSRLNWRALSLPEHPWTKGSLIYLLPMSPVHRSSFGFNQVQQRHLTRRAASQSGPPIAVLRYCGIASVGVPCQEKFRPSSYVGPWPVFTGQFSKAVKDSNPQTHSYQPRSSGFLRHKARTTSSAFRSWSLTAFCGDKENDIHAYLYLYCIYV